jgi:hypothetical protein
MARLDLERLGIPHFHRQGRHGDRLAPEGFWPVLELEDSPWQARPPSGAERDSPVDSFASRENPLWGAPHIHGELLKLGIDIGETSVSKYMVRHRKPPSQTWRTFLDNHLKAIVSVDFFVVPTIRFQILYVFLILARAPAHCPLCRHRTSDRGVDGATNARSLSVGCGSAVSAARSRPDLRL